MTEDEMVGWHYTATIPGGDFSVWTESRHHSAARRPAGHARAAPSLTTACRGSGLGVGWHKQLQRATHVQPPACCLGDARVRPGLNP